MRSRIKPLVFIGESPGPQTDPERPLYPHTTVGAAAKLMDLAGLELEDYLALSSRVNAYHDGRRKLSLEEARHRVMRYMTVALHRYRAPRFVFLGCAAMRTTPQIYRRMEPATCRDTVMYLPHTSGVNRWYNSEENTQTARVVLRQHIAPALKEARAVASRVLQQAPPAVARAWGGTATASGGSGAPGALQKLAAALPGATLPAGPGHTPEEIQWLLKKWDQETGYLSSPPAIARHCIPQKLRREEGLRLVPHLIENLRGPEPRQPWGCFELLGQITQARPWAPEDAGDYLRTRQAWVSWYDSLVAAD